jgi:RimJ/RimL family protein N-acetyltransferase
MKMPFPLETERLYLRHFSDSDLDAFVTYRNDPQVARYQGWEVPFLRDTGQAFIEEMKNAVPGLPGKWFQAAIEIKPSEEIIGDCAFHVMKNDHRQAFIGITLARDSWGKGYGEETCRRLIDYLFDELNLHRVVAECDAENNASSKLLMRLGFRREAELIENIWFKGSWGSEFHYAILEREWKKE